MLDINNIDDLNKTFCNLVGIKPVKSILINPKTNEMKTYTTTNCLYRKPKGWENSKVITFDIPKYPDFTDVENHQLLIDIQWKLFGSIGDTYTQMRDESFAVNYLYMKIRAMQTIRSLGGSDMLEDFCEMVRNSDYTVTIDHDVYDKVMEENND